MQRSFTGLDPFVRVSVAVAPEQTGPAPLPKDEATFDEKEFAENWVDPESLRPAKSPASVESSASSAAGTGEQNPAQSGGSRLAELAKANPDAGRFRDWSQQFNKGFDAVVGAVDSTLKKQHETIALSDKQKGLFVTKPTSHGLLEHG